MKAVGGIVQQDFCAKNVVLCVYISVRALYEFKPKNDMCITNGGRIVTKCGLPWSAITMVRRNNDEGTEVSLGPSRFPPPQAPAGSKRTRSRDSKGGSPYAVNNTDLPLRDGTIRTKHGDKELRTGHFNMLAR